MRNCRVADAVLPNQSPAVEFPANREKNREKRESTRFWLKRRSNKSDGSATYQNNSLRGGTGNYFVVAGKELWRMGANRESLDDNDRRKGGQIGVIQSLGAKASCGAFRTVTTRSESPMSVLCDPRLALGAVGRLHAIR